MWTDLDTIARVNAICGPDGYSLTLGVLALFECDDNRPRDAEYATHAEDAVTSNEARRAARGIPRTGAVS